VESLGNLLKTAREEKGYTIDSVSRETNIAGRYLDALEREDYTVFPGEPYLLGFLKNYGAYLELNVNELLQLYRSYKIQEQPVPVDVLLKTPSRAPKIIMRLVVAVVILGLIAAGVLFFFTKLNKPAMAVPPPRVPVQYQMNDDSLEKRIYSGDSILVTIGNDSYTLELAELGDTVTLNTPTGPVRLDLSQEAALDLNGDGFPELTVTIADFAKNDSSAGALIRLEINNPPAAEPVITADDIPPAGSGSIVLLTAQNPYPFTLQAVFQGYCLFRWEILFERDRPGRNEQYFQQSDELNIQAQNGIRLGISNAQAVKLQVIGGGGITKPLEAGGPGEVVVADLRWVKDDSGSYRLVFNYLE